MDYITLSGAATIPEGFTTADIEVSPYQDALLEWDETVADRKSVV